MDNSFNIRCLEAEEMPTLLAETPEPPKKMFIRGTLPNKDTVCIAVVGSRRCTNYGKEACKQILTELSDAPVTILSGLALGIDAVAHQTALEAGLHTVAIPGSGLSDAVLYPKTNFRLAHDILQAGGALLSEYEPDFRATTWSFPRRNRIMAGMAKAVLVVEAGDRSGTLITARLALDYNREVLAIPGSIFSAGSKGANSLISRGATPVTCGSDILSVLGLSSNTPARSSAPRDCSNEELLVLDSLSEPRSKTQVLEHLKLPAQAVSQSISLLEIKGYIRERNGILYKL